MMQQFAVRWNYTGCLGAVDGKHIKIMKPPMTGSLFYNYKHFFSIVLMAVVNGNYEFLYCNVGAEGKTADGGCWATCDLPRAMSLGMLQVPKEIHLPYNLTVPCHFVADDAFPMSTTLLKPFPQKFLTKRERIFNYRLSRARRLVENVFGIISSRFACLRSEIRFNVANATNVVLAICVLHNILRQKCGASYMPPGSYDVDDVNFNFAPGEWRHQEQLTGMQSTRARNASNKAKQMRNDLADYFMSEAGSVPWQNESIENDVSRIVGQLSEENA